MQEYISNYHRLTRRFLTWKTQMSKNIEELLYNLKSNLTPATRLTNSLRSNTFVRQPKTEFST